MSDGRSKLWHALSWPNRISILRLILIAPFVVLLLNQRQWPFARHAALGIFAVMAVSDFLDGLLARRLNAKTRLGAILDPLADKALIIWSVVLLAREASAVPGARLANWVVVAIVGKDLWVIAGFVVIYLVTDRFRIQPTLAGKAATFGQCVMMVCVLLAPDINALAPAWRVGSWLALGTSWAVAGLSVLAVMAYTRLGLRFVTAEQKPLNNHSDHDNVRDDPH